MKKLSLFSLLILFYALPEIVHAQQVGLGSGEGAIKFYWPEQTPDSRRLWIMATGIGADSYGYKFSWRNDDGSARSSFLEFEHTGETFFRTNTYFGANVGIGTDAPGEKLDINGNLALSSGSGSINFLNGDLDGSDVSFDGANLFLRNNNSNGDVEIRSEDDIDIYAADNIRITPGDKSGRDPSPNLDVTIVREFADEGEFGFAHYLKVLPITEDLNLDGGISYLGDEARKWSYIYGESIFGDNFNIGELRFGNTRLLSSDGQISFFANGTNTELARIDEAGGDLQLAATSPSGNVGLYTNGQQRFRVSETGQLFAFNLQNIGDQRNMQYNDITGEIGFDNSSRRDKRKIKNLQADFESLLKAVPKTYVRPWSPDYWEIGFIAEDFHDLGLFPLVEYDADGRPDGIRYDKMVTYIIPLLREQQRAVQDRDRQIEQQQQQIENLETRLAKLEARFSGPAGFPTHKIDLQLQGEDRPLLQQNAPNPFNQNTRIDYYLPVNTTNARFQITDPSGKVLKSIQLKTVGEGRINLDAQELPSGTYQYSLIIEGRPVVTKQMVLTRSN